MTTLIVCALLLIAVVPCKAGYSWDYKVQTSYKGDTMTQTITTHEAGTRIQHKGCGNDYELCGYWAMFGECHRSSKFMRTNCKWSCGFCGALECEDKAEQCKYWATIGECQKNPNYMLSNCRVSCEVCNPGCRDQHRYCRDWAHKGECSKNPEYMHKKCPWSCWTC